MISQLQDRAVRAFLTDITRCRARGDARAAVAAAREFIAHGDFGDETPAVLGVICVAARAWQEAKATARGEAACALADRTLLYAVRAGWAWLDAEAIAQPWMEKELREAAG